MRPQKRALRNIGPQGVQYFTTWYQISYHRTVNSDLNKEENGSFSGTLMQFYSIMSSRGRLMRFSSRQFPEPRLNWSTQSPCVKVGQIKIFRKRVLCLRWDSDLGKGSVHNSLRFCWDIGWIIRSLRSQLILSGHPV